MEVRHTLAVRPPELRKQQNWGIPENLGADDHYISSVPERFKGYQRIAATQVPHPMAAQAYYDSAADQKLKAAYYKDLPQDPVARAGALGKLVASTHKPIQGGYNSALAILYGKMDRHPDGVLRCVYSKKPVEPAKYPNMSLDTLEASDVSALAAAAMGSPEVLGAWLAFKQGRPALNCEHVVPQTNFNRKEPMRSDLHHLFACDDHTNSIRGNQLYGDYVPEGGKGKVARATLYFMLRHPDTTLPYTPNQIEMLKSWSLEDPPDEHERHRNAEIQKLQGNRNPYIDNPDWVKDFTLKRSRGL